MSRDTKIVAIGGHDGHVEILDVLEIPNNNILSNVFF